MAINLKTDELILLRDAAKNLPARLSVTPNTVWRWHRYGRRGIRLQSVRVAGRIFTTREAVIEFVQLTSGEGQR